jgi:hypothetical protein
MNLEIITDMSELGKPVIYDPYDWPIEYLVLG